MLLFCPYTGISQNNTADIESLIRVWGAVKYCHPDIAKGDTDWDNVFLTHYTWIMQAKEQNTDSVYHSWLGDSSKAIRNGKPEDICTEAEIIVRQFSDTNLFGPALARQLSKMITDGVPADSWYAHTARSKKTTPAYSPYFDHEHVYTDSVFPSPPMRMLTLARYWNTIEYLYPYRHMMGERWDSVLKSMIPIFAGANDTLSYHLAINELVASLHDNHSYFNTAVTISHFGKLFPPFQFRFVNDTMVVAGWRQKDSTDYGILKAGDIITEADGQSINELMQARIPYITGSSTATLRRNSYMLLNSKDTFLSMTVHRGDSTFPAVVARAPYSSIAIQDKHKEPYRRYNDSIGYIDLSQLQSRKVRSTLRKMKHTSAIIFDLRRYPNWTVYKLAKYLVPRHTTFCRFTITDKKHPGCMKTYATMRCGKRRHNYYRGQVVILTDEYTQSRAEFTVMALQKAPKSITIGRATAGTDGNVWEIVLPGGFRTWMTGLGVYYPDGKCTQFSGIQPDIEVPATIAAIATGKDIILERALEYVRNNSH